MSGTVEYVRELISWKKKDKEQRITDLHLLLRNVPRDVVDEYAATPPEEVERIFREKTQK